ncbi:hypothetical protein [Roseovarius aestuariivivens]|uniref:hypothetical protein n=1 Tax=Roseovarius aestuariivivens TaxID=1888910 RepID=UPI001080299E|nr:hypothetical protein [Roseovarius aestuariivivens]
MRKAPPARLKAFFYGPHVEAGKDFDWISDGRGKAFVQSVERLLSGLPDRLQDKLRAELDHLTTLADSDGMKGAEKVCAGQGIDLEGLQGNKDVLLMLAVDHPQIIGRVSVERPDLIAVAGDYKVLATQIASALECRPRAPRPLAEQAWHIETVRSDAADIAVYVHPCLETMQDLHSLETVLSRQVRPRFGLFAYGGWHLGSASHDHRAPLIRCSGSMRRKVVLWPRSARPSLSTLLPSPRVDARPGTPT